MKWLTALVVLGAWAGPALAGVAADSVRAAITAERFADAERSARALILEIEGRSPLDSLALGEACDLLVQALWRGGRATSPGASEVAERAQQLRERAANVPPLALANSLHQRANLLKAAGRFDGVRPLYERALEIRLALLGPSHADVARNLNDYGNLLLHAGAYAEAESLYLRSCGVYEALGEAQKGNLGRCLNNLAVLRQTAGDYAGARPTFERARRLFEEALGPKHPNVATADVNLASLLLKTGDRDEALALLARARPIYVEAEGPDHADVAWVRRVEGEAYTDAGDLARARTALEAAAAIHEKSLGAAHPELALDLGLLARVETAAGHDSVAEAHLTRALRIHEQALGANHALVARDLEGLARLRARHGDLGGARALLERSLAIREVALGADHPEVASSLIALAAVAWAQGARDSARQLALRAESVSREHLRLTLRALPERQAMTVARERARGLDLALSIPGASGNDSALVDAIVRSRAVVLDEMIRRGRSISQRVEPGMKELAARLVAARDRLARITVKGPGNEPPERYRRIRDDARRAREEAERELAQSSLRYRENARAQDAGLADVAAALPSDAALVHYVVYERSADSTEWLERPPAGTPASWQSRAARHAPAYAALVLAPGKEPALIPLGAAASIDTLAVRWRRETIGARALPGWRWKAAEAECRRAGERLRRAVWDPLAGSLGAAGRVYMVTDGSLELVAFAALPVGDRYLVEMGPTLHRLTSARDLAAPPDSSPATHALIAVGNPDFNAGRTTGASASPASFGPCAAEIPAFPPLPGSEAEASWVAGFWNHELKNHGVEGDSARALTGAAATEAAFRRQAPGCRVLHLATHGFTMMEGCRSDGKRSGGPDFTDLSFGGLALAGANRRGGAAGAEDGILTAEEIAALDLGAAEWVVLSSCNSGTGEVLPGEGVVGLRRAFEVAGCHGLVVSLWPVQDEATETWMKALYRARFERGLSTDEAVRAASRALLDQRRREGASTHPFAWAAFIAAGDPR